MSTTIRIRFSAVETLKLIGANIDDEAIERIQAAYEQAVEKIEAATGLDVRLTRREDEETTGWGLLGYDADDRDADRASEALGAIWQQVHELCSGPLGPNGKFALDGWTWTVRDVTENEQKALRVETAILRADEVAEVEKAVQFAAETWTGCDWPDDSYGFDLEGEQAEDWHEAAKAADEASALGDLPEHFGNIPRGDVLRAVLSKAGADWPLNDEPRSLGELSSAARRVWGQGGPARLLQETALHALHVAEHLQGVEGDAKRAAECGRRAVSALRHGLWDVATDEARKAVEVEGNYGDAPAWATVVDAVAEFVGDAE